MCIVQSGCENKSYYVVEEDQIQIGQMGKVKVNVLAPWPSLGLTALYRGAAQREAHLASSVL